MPDGHGKWDADAVGDLDGYAGALGGLTRREFLAYCTGIAATLGLSPGFGVTIANAATNAASAARPTVIWLSGSACTGCTESLLRTNHPTLETLILDTISLDYNETLSAGAGHQAESFKQASMKANWGKYIMVADGAVPVGNNGVYCKVAGKPYMEAVRECAAGAAAVISIGSCSSWGGWPSTGPNPSGAVGLKDVITDKPVISVPGCPPNPYNFLSLVLHYVTFGTLPELDHKNRPKFAFGRLIHENCERRPHFDAGRFAKEFGDDGHRQGWCLYKLGCKGPETYANCPAIGFNDVGPGTWPVGTGHPCFGCSEQGVGFTKSIHELATLKSVSPPNSYPGVATDKGDGLSAGAAAVLAGLTGAAVGAGAVVASRLGKQDDAAADAPKSGE